MLFTKGARPGATNWLVCTFSRAAWQYRFHVSHALDLPKDLVLSATERARQRHYFYGASYLATLMSSLRNQSLSKQEWYLFSNLSTLAAIFDDLVEVFRKTAPSNFGQLEGPDIFGQTADPRGLALHLLRNIERNLSAYQLQPFQEYLFRVFKVETTLPNEAAININTLEGITAEKGGASVLLFRSVLENPISEAEATALFQFGHLTQFVDDLFDLWHDQQTGAITVPIYFAKLNDLDRLVAKFEAQARVAQQAFRQIPFPAQQIETAIAILGYLIRLAQICLQQYQGSIQRTGYFPMHDRTAMVVDMQKWSNLWKLIRQPLQPIR